MHGRRVAIVALLSVLFATMAWASWWEPRRLTVTRIDIREGRLAAVLAGRTAALLSDLHFRADGEPVAAQALQKLDELRPDLILVAGDLVAWGSHRESYERALDFLARLRAPLGVYGVLGDADRTSSRGSCDLCHREGTGEPTTRHQVVFLRDSGRIVETGRGSVLLAGIDVKLRRPLSSTQQRLLGGDSPVIVISHSSLAFREVPAGRDALVVAGDTHGGQVRLPEWLWRSLRIKADPEHLYGFYRTGNKALFVTRGIGTSRFRLRLGVPPELVLFSFGKAQ